MKEEKILIGTKEELTMHFNKLKYTDSTMDNLS